MEQNERGVIMGLIASAQASLAEALRRLDASPESGATPPEAAVKTVPLGDPCEHPDNARKAVSTMGDAGPVYICMACGVQLDA